MAEHYYRPRRPAPRGLVGMLRALLLVELDRTGGTLGPVRDAQRLLSWTLDEIDALAEAERPSRCA